MNNGSDLDQIAAQAVNNPVVLEDEFPQILSAVFGNDPTGMRKLAQLLDMSDNALDKEPRE